MYRVALRRGWGHWDTSLCRVRGNRAGNKLSSDCNKAVKNILRMSVVCLYLAKVKMEIKLYDGCFFPLYIAIFERQCLWLCQNVASCHQFPMATWRRNPTPFSAIVLSSDFASSVLVYFFLQENTDAFSPWYPPCSLLLWTFIALSTSTT